LPNSFLHLFLHLGHARLAAHEDHVVDVGERTRRRPSGRAAGRDGALDQLVDQRLQLGAR
jgi:hypothetical protein